MAEERTIDIGGNNTSNDYKEYSTSIRIASNDTVCVKMARYCYFSSTITGKGTLKLLAGGERCYLGTEKGKTWPNWTNFSGNVEIWPWKENSSSAGFYGVVLAHGGKSMSPENYDQAINEGKVNTSMANNRVTLHAGATICCEANTSGAGFRIGELQIESGAHLQGYMKNSRAAYYIVGGMNTDASLDGEISPSSYRDDTPLGLIKEGTGTYRITGHDNYLSGGLRIVEGRVLVMNDVNETKRLKSRGALGAMADNSNAVAFVFSQGTLGGTGSIGGSVDNYGVIEPGDDGVGTLTLKNFKESKEAHLFVRPASVLSFKLATTESHDELTVDGNVKYIPITEDFSSSDKMPVIVVKLADGADVKVGDEFLLLTAKKKTSQGEEWHFDVKAEKYTWKIEEREEDGTVKFVARLVSFADMNNGDDPDTPDDPEERMGAFYDDGINDRTDRTTLREYASKNGKWIGTAISMWKNDLSNSSLSETKEVGNQFNMLVAENEMKFDALEPQRGSFSYQSADALVLFAQQHDMAVRGHCLVWHSQLPQWVSSDGKKNDMNWSRTEALQIMEKHISEVMKHFKGKVREWDVVNECLDDDQQTVRTNPTAYDLRTQSVWHRAIGDDYIDSAFVYAHRADPEALLYLNDYGVEMQGHAKSIAFYNLAMRLKSSGIPIDGVGLQCHFSIGGVDSVKLANTFERFREAGLKCIITELDMGVPSTSDKDLEEQARNYRVITDIMLNNDNCPSMVIWGLKDNNSWREASNPLLYTSGLTRKPAWYAVRSALRHRTLGNTLIEHIQSPFGTPSPIYDIMGRRLTPSHLPYGIYIKDGKKYGTSNNFKNINK